MGTEKLEIVYTMAYAHQSAAEDTKNLDPINIIDTSIPIF